MDIKQIEDKALDHIISISLGLPSILLPMLWSLLSNFLPEEVKNNKLTQALLSLSGYLLLLSLVLATFIFLLIRRHKEKPDFSQFTHDPENSCWTNNINGQRICESCKASDKIIPLSRHGNGWKCPLHEHIVGRPKDIGMPINIDNHRSPWSL